MSNPQDGNVANPGDVLKHLMIGQLLANAMSNAVDEVAYVETHAYRLSAPPADLAGWKAWMDRHDRGIDLIRYRERQKIAVDAGGYRCSAGLAVDIATEHGGRVALHLAERDAETRALLAHQLGSCGLPHRLYEDGQEMLRSPLASDHDAVVAADRSPPIAPHDHLE